MTRRKRPEEYARFIASMNRDFATVGQTWICINYKEHRNEEKFNRLPKAERAELESAFMKRRYEGQQMLLNMEATRLGCEVDEVFAKAPVLPLRSKGRQSKLADLPDDIFIQIMQKLNTVDIFRITLVSRRWKSYVYDNRMELKGAEHALSTHLLTFCKWEDPSWSMDLTLMVSSYESFRWSLLYWCCKLSQCNEKIVTDCMVAAENLLALLENCPHLKHLELGNKFTCRLPEEKLFDIGNRFFFELKFLSIKHHSDEEDRLAAMKIWSKAPNLKALSTPMTRTNLLCITSNLSKKDALSNLVALELYCLDSQILKDMTMIHEFNLQYFKLSTSGIPLKKSTRFQQLREIRFYFHEVLSRMQSIEILGVDRQPGVSARTLKLLCDMNVKLRKAVLYETEHDGEVENEQDVNEKNVRNTKISSALLQKFQNLIRRNKPNVDLSEIEIILRRGQKLEEPAWDKIELSVKTKEANKAGWDKMQSLKDPAIRKMLSLKL